MPDKFLTRDATTGRTTEVEATATGGTNAQSGKVLALDGSGRISSTVLPSGIGADTFTGNAVTALSAGDVVSIVTGGVQRASAAASGTDVDGFVLDGFAQGATALVYLEGRDTAKTGLTVGTRYYLSDATPGAITDTPVTGAGKKHQYVGKAITTTSLAFEPDEPITLA